MSSQINPSSLGLSVQAATPVAGYSLVDGTGNIVTWTVPNDGKLHYALPFATLSVTTSMTGGNIYFNGVAPDGTDIDEQMIAPQTGPQSYWTGFAYPVIVQAGSLVAVSQQFALTVGAAKVWAGIMGY